MEPFECSGVWWSLNDPSSRVAGILRFSHKHGIRLDLLGTFGGVGVGDIGTKSHDIILGLAYNSPWGQSITLTGCILARSTMNSSGLSSEEYRVERAFFGRHLTTPPDFLFNFSRLAISGLSAWAAHLTGFRFNYDDERGESGWGFQLAYTPPSPLQAKVAGAEIILFIGAGNSQTLRERSIKEEVGLTIETTEPIGEADWNDRYVYPLQNLLTLATDTPNALTKWELSGVEDRFGPVVVVVARVFKGSGEDSDIGPHQMLFPLAGLEGRFPTLVARWLEISVNYRAACNVFFALRYAPGAYTDMRLMGFSQALEHYLSRRLNIHPSANPEIPPGVLASLPQDKQEELRSWAENLAVDTFRGTLRRLADEHRTTLEPLVAPHGLERLIDQLIKYRTYVLHRLDCPEGEHYTIGLFLAAETLSCLMKSCFLAELGFTADERPILFQRNAMYGYLQGKWSELLAGE